MTNHHGRKKRLRALREKVAELAQATEVLEAPSEPEEAPVEEEAAPEPVIVEEPVEAPEGTTWPEE